MDYEQLLQTRYFDYATLLGLGRAESARYQSASPFPHAVLEGLMPEDVLNEICACIPAPQSAVPWRHRDRLLPGTGAVQLNKLGLSSEHEVAAPVRRLLRELNSGSFLRFLCNLTGIEGLLPDPSLQGAGIHQVLRDGMLAVHADFTWHKVYALKRRVNVLIYLNHDWREEYGGHLQLWDSGMNACVRRIMPSFGRCVIFNTGARSYHGHPEPVRCPEGITRRSIAMYYYTADRDDEPVEDTRATDWRVAPQTCLPAVE